MYTHVCQCAYCKRAAAKEAFYMSVEPDVHMNRCVGCGATPDAEGRCFCDPKLQRRSNMDGDLKGYVVLSEGKAGSMGQLYMLDGHRQPQFDEWSAKTEAEKLAAKNPGCKFYVARLVTVSEVPPATITRSV